MTSQKSKQSTARAAAKSATETSKAAVEAARKELAEKVETAASQASAHAADLSEKTRADVADLAEKARAAASAGLDSAKDGASDKLDETADQIRKAGRDFGKDSYQAQAAEYLADTLVYVSERIRDQDLAVMADDARAFAKRNPALVLGGAAILGFMAFRMIKSGSGGRA